MEALKSKITLFIALCLGVMLYFGSQAYKEAIAYEKHTTELVGYQDIAVQAKRKLENFAKSILGSLYEDSNETKVFEAIKKKQAIAMQDAQTYTIYFMITAVVILASYFLTSLRVFTFIGALVAMVSLIFGLITPILMVTIHKEVEYLGDIVLSFESKGVIGSIVKLWESGDFIVAGVILLFSVITPTLKVFSLMFVSLFMESKFAHNIVKFFKMIGKWSMVDVFVVAVFLVYLTANKGDVSRAEVEVGLYFFLAYVIVSMLVSLSADKMLKQSRK
jgi:hypothetical protein